MKRRAFLATAGGAVVALSGCTSGGSGAGNDSKGDESIRTQSATLTFEVPAIDAGRLRSRITCDGENVSPNLVVVAAAAPITSLALVVTDPDAGPDPFVHWTLWDVPSTLEEVPENLANEARVTLDVETDGEPPTVSQGTNSEGTVGYTGPCSPNGESHRYQFTMYGLTEPLDVEPGAEPARVRAALDEAAVAGQTSYVATYGGESSE
ncbi:YbhB/YbcL family Raf kinase inhibitor-like protein [Halomarina salina]|uniref:YbhB/YbcL family Raf kinase inhibitor-like protein n=1 Tax=Halomarina salina TaxID=1872699 RepID=A0ABD5RMW2_9EURY|nr:YbhB/YbcL family Raf kinase inhibitor-like protein [Halomarina salina]